MIHLKGVEKYFGDHRVLSNIDLQIEKREVVLLIGPSGSGKSTLLRTINCLEPPTSGEVIIQGRLVETNSASLRELRTHVGMVFQDINLFPHLTAAENVALAPVLIKKESRSSARTRGVTLLERVGLGGKQDRYPSQLSGGEKQRVGIARALAMTPQIMLFDEPTSSLDPEMVQEVLQVMQRLVSEGMTMVVATHEIGFARAVGDRVVFMDNGQIVEEGAAVTLLDSPQHERTRSFLRSVQ